MNSYPVPTRVALEVFGHVPRPPLRGVTLRARRPTPPPEIRRVGAYVVDVDPDNVWVHVGGDTKIPEGLPVRMTFRIEGYPSLGMSGAIVHGDHDTIGVRVTGEIARAVLAAWAAGGDADVSPSQRVFRSETPTTDTPRIPAASTELLGSGRRTSDTVQDFVFVLPHA